MLKNSTEPEKMLGEKVESEDKYETIYTLSFNKPDPPPPKSNTFPLKNVSLSLFNFKNISNSLNASFHSVLKLKKFDPSKINNNYFLKREKDAPNPILYVLEAASGAYYELIAPNSVPATRAVYNEELGEYVGVCSKEIPGFQSLKKRPLTKEDVFISEEALNNFTIPEIEGFDLLAENSNALLQTKKLDDVISRKIIKETKTVSVSSSFSLSTSIMWMIGKNTAPPKTTTIVTEKEIVFTVKDLLAYRVRKGNAIGIALSLFCGEADFHMDNGSYLGERIDFDMSFWDFLYHFKKLNIFERHLRPPNSCNFSEEDIVNCPVYKTSSHLYGPTQPEPIFEPIRTAISSITPVSQNAFPEAQRKIYAEFSHDPIFIYHKYKTWLKCLLLDQEMILNNNKLHIPSHFMHDVEVKTILESFSQHEYQRGINFRNIMVTTQQFKEFMKNYGDFAFTCIIQEFEKRNAKYKNKEKYKNVNILIDIDIIKNRFSEIKDELNNTHTGHIDAIDNTEYDIKNENNESEENELANEIEKDFFYIRTSNPNNDAPPKLRI